MIVFVGRDKHDGTLRGLQGQVVTPQWRVNIVPLYL